MRCERPKGLIYDNLHHVIFTAEDVWYLWCQNTWCILGRCDRWQYHKKIYVICDMRTFTWYDALWADVIGDRWHWGSGWAPSHQGRTSKLLLTRIHFYSILKGNTSKPLLTRIYFYVILKSNTSKQLPKRTCFYVIFKGGTSKPLLTRKYFYVILKRWNKLLLTMV